MKGKKILVPVLIILVLAAVAVAVYISMNPVDTTLEFQVRDAVSKNWVWDATFKLQNRVIRGYYQSDRGPIVFRFTHLKPGEATLEVSAPHYEPVSRQVTLKRGRKRLAEPIDLVGYEIPDLGKFIIFESRAGNDILCEIRPASTQGPAVLNHPSMDLWIGARVTLQMKKGLPVQEETEEGSVRGEELFRGKIEWEWDPLPETVFRYSARIPGSKIKANKDPYWVIDYLIVVPDPRKITKEELNKIMEKTWELDPLEVEKYLAPYKERKEFSYYIFTSWNVQGGAS